jgi:hypothetical protein
MLSRSKTAPRRVMRMSGCSRSGPTGMMSRPPFAQLIEQLARHRVRGRSDQYPVERRVGRPTLEAVAVAQVHVADLEVAQTRRARCCSAEMRSML